MVKVIIKIHGITLLYMVVGTSASSSPTSLSSLFFFSALCTGASIIFSKKTVMVSVKA